MITVERRKAPTTALSLLGAVLILVSIACNDQTLSTQRWSGPTGDVTWSDAQHCIEGKPTFAKRNDLRAYLRVPGTPATFIADAPVDELPVEAIDTGYHLRDRYTLWRSADRELLYVVEEIPAGDLVFRYEPGGCD